LLLLYGNTHRVQQSGTGNLPTRLGCQSSFETGCMHRLKIEFIPLFNKTKLGKVPIESN